DSGSLRAFALPVEGGSGGLRDCPHFSHARFQGQIAARSTGRSHRLPGQLAHSGGSMKRFAVWMFAAAVLPPLAPPQVPFGQLARAVREPHNWLTFSGNLQGTRYSALDQIKVPNAANLDLKWVYQVQSLEKFEATPLVVDSVMYTVEPPNTVVAIDTRT